MVLLKIFKKNIPSFRHKKATNIYDNNFVFFKKFVKKHKSPIKRVKKIYITRSVTINSKMWTFSNYITKTFVYKFKPYKKFIQCQSLDNFNIIIPGIEFLNIGKVLYSYRFLNDKKSVFFYKGFIVQLGELPITAIFSNILNYNNKKITFARSTGTYCRTRKIKKTKLKLIAVLLPSGQEIFLNKYTKGYLGKNENLKTSEVVEGKWGFSQSLKKHINVRGVAMNPVDHPNGGRAKTVQPERSPWNWVAKKKK